MTVTDDVQLLIARADTYVQLQAERTNTPMAAPDLVAELAGALRVMAEHCSLGLDARALTIALGVAELEPEAYDVTRGAGVRCVFCDAEPPGNAATLAPANHRASCLWMEACRFAEDLRA